MKCAAAGVFLLLIACGCESKDQEMEEVGKIVLLDEAVVEEGSLEKGAVTEEQGQEVQVLRVDPEEVVPEQ